MQKIRVRQTVRAAYNFLTDRFGQIVSVCAVPFAALAIIDFLVQSWLWSSQIRVLSGDPGAAIPDIVVNLAVLALGWVDAALVGLAAAGLHRMVLFEKPIPTLSFGKTERRFVLVSVLFTVVFQAPAIVAGAAVELLSGTPPTGQAVAVRAAAPFLVMGAVVTLVFAILSVRLLQMFPVSVAEHRIAPARSWALTRGNWWRTIGCYVLAFLPIVIFAWIGLLIISPTLGNGGEAPASLLEIVQGQRAVLWLTIAFNTILGVITAALGVGILSYSYKQLTGLPLDAAVDEPGQAFPVARI